MKVNYNSCSYLSGNFRQTEVSIMLFARQGRDLGKAGRRLAAVPPAAPALAFMRDGGAALMPGVPPDPAQMAELYSRHASYPRP